MKYIAMAGMKGCLPNISEEYASYDEAVEGLADRLDLGRRRKAQLKRDGHLELCLHGRDFPYLPPDGNEYCEVVESEED